MRTIELRKLKVEESTFDEREVLTMIVENAPTHGYVIGQMRTAVAVLTKLKAAEESVRLEDAEWQWLSDRLNNTTWMKAISEAIAMIDRIQGAKADEIPMPPAPKPDEVQ